MYLACSGDSAGSRSLAMPARGRNVRVGRFWESGSGSDRIRKDGRLRGETLEVSGYRLIVRGVC